MGHDPQTIRANATTAAKQGLATGPGAPANAGSPRAASSDRAAFLREFLRYPQQIGSVVPSSPFLEDRLVRAADAASARTIVELGPGTGGTTRALLRAMRSDARLLAIDLSPTFCVRLSAAIPDRRLIVQRGSAEHIETFLKRSGLPKADAILSGIPFSTMPPEAADRIARAITAALAPGGRFVAYQVRAHVARFTTPYLGEPRKEREWRNVPPLQVFTWIRSD